MIYSFSSTDVVGNHIKQILIDKAFMWSDIWKVDHDERCFSYFYKLIDDDLTMEKFVDENGNITIEIFSTTLGRKYESLYNTSHI